MNRFILGTIILLISACHYSYYLDTNKIDNTFDRDEIYGSYSSHDKYTSGEYILYPANRYLLSFHNCFGNGQEVGTIKIDGRRISFIADSTFMIENLKQNDTVWKSCTVEQNYYYFDGGLHMANQDHYYKQSTYHK